MCNDLSLNHRIQDNSGQPQSEFISRNRETGNDDHGGIIDESSEQVKSSLSEPAAVNNSSLS